MNIRMIGFALILSLITVSAFSQNPIIQTKFTADPAPLVYRDTVFLYTTHDEDDAGPGMGKFLMKEWLLYTSTDMVNWTDHGAVAALKNFSWGKQQNGAWAPQCIERNGKFYLYCPVQGSGIGVLVSDSPYGPFKDPLGKALIETDHMWNDIDPTVFIDDDGQAYLYWGNPSLWYVKLNPDMISHNGAVTKVPGIGKEKGQNNPDDYHYQEGPWTYKRKGHYYLAYASTCCPEGIGYAMSSSPTGPWDFKGYLMRPDKRSSGNHPGIIDFKGKSYLFGFNYHLNFMQTQQHHERRSICVEVLNYNADGTIKELPWWSETGISQVGTLNPFRRVEAETINWSEGIKTIEDISAKRIAVAPQGGKSFIKVRGVDFQSGAKTFNASISSQTDGGILEIRIDQKDGPLIGKLNVKATGSTEIWGNIQGKLKQTKGKHDVYFLFKADPFKIDWWELTK